jgi:hypothetical protein
MKIIPAPTCHHLFPDDHRCGSPSLRGEAFCYFHHPDRQPVATVPKSIPARSHKRGTYSSKSYECKHLQCPFRHERRVPCPLTPTP